MRIDKWFEESYYIWLTDFVGGWHNNKSYWELLYLLHHYEFHWYIDNDANRAEDGKDLRDLYVSETGYHPMTPVIFRTRPCTMLEMMVALAKRCDDDIAYDAKAGDRTALWFWTMIFNMGLGACTDEHFDRVYAAKRIEKCLKRQYKWDGSDGGMFVVKDSPRDLRKTEIWYQCNFYMLDAI